MLANRQSLRSFVAFLVTWAFVILTVSGLVLYVVPQGRVAYWVHWSLGGLDKEAWGHLHMLFGGLFIVGGALHLYYNWKPFTHYLARRAAGRLRLSRELVGSLVASALLTAGALWEVPPVSWVFDLNDEVKAMWVTAPDLEPPFGHAEEVSVAGIARRMQLDADRGTRALREAGLAPGEEGDSLDQIARANGTTPMALYAILRRYPAAPVVAPEGRAEPLTAVEVESRFAGTGLGRLTVSEVAAKVGLDPEQVATPLREAGIEFQSEDNLRTLAERRDVSPIDLLKLMLVPGYRIAP